jgi:hypothetical protein
MAFLEGDASETPASHVCGFYASDLGRTRQAASLVESGRFAREGDFDHVLEYEAGYERLSRRFPVTTACLYDARSYSGLETARLVQRHPDLFRHPDAHFVS